MATPLWRRALACLLPALLVGLGSSGAVQAQSIATGARHGLALQPDGSVLAWGDNRQGQLGQGRTLYAEAAREIPLSAKAMAVRASSTNALVLDDQGNVWSWGTNRRGQLGDGTRTDRATPSIVFRNAAQLVDNGGDQRPSWVLDRDGQPWWWGPLPSGGELTQPVQAARVPARLVRVLSSGRAMAALDDQGVVWSWGVGAACAGASQAPGEAFAMRDVPPIKDFVVVGDTFNPDRREFPDPVASQYISRIYAVDRDGKYWKWGAEVVYSSGMARLQSTCPPVQSLDASAMLGYQPRIHADLVKAGTVIKRVIPSNQWTTAGLTENGDLWLWRQVQSGPPGSAPPVTLSHEASGVLDASSYSTDLREGTQGLIYITRDGRVLAKGSNANLHLALSSNQIDSVAGPQRVPLPAGAASVHVMPDGGYAVLKDGRVFNWGLGAAQYDPSANLNWYVPRPGPSQIGIPASIAKLAVTEGRWLALDSSGNVWSSDEWGSGVKGSGLLRPTMVSRANGLPPARDIALGGSAGATAMAAILGVDGSVWTIGAFAGVSPPPSPPLQNFDDVLSHLWTPKKVLALPSSIVQVAAIGGYIGAAAYALDASGSVWFWGQHAYGIGGRSVAAVGGDLIVNVPYVLPLRQKAVSIHTNAYDYGFCAILEDGSAQCYGKMFNEHAGMHFRLHAPIKELAVGGAEQAMGRTTDRRENTVHFRLADGTVWAWGQGRYGQLGAGIHANTAEPVPVNNEAGTGDLDLDPTTPNVPTANRPPFRVKTRLEGNLRTLSFNADVFGAATGGGTGNGTTNLYAFATADLRTWIQLDGEGQWSLLRSPVPAAASNVPLATEAQSVPLNILPQFIGTGLAGVRVFVGQGRDAQEMLQARRFREVLELAPED
jgi:alpha-tubulin suppressor-like RCC1 family protein